MNAKTKLTETEKRLGLQEMSDNIAAMTRISSMTMAATGTDFDSPVADAHFAAMLIVGVMGFVRKNKTDQAKREEIKELVEAALSLADEVAEGFGQQESVKG